MSAVCGIKCDICGRVWDDYNHKKDNMACAQQMICAQRDNIGDWYFKNISGDGTHICMICASEVSETFNRVRDEGGVDNEKN